VTQQFALRNIDVYYPCLEANELSRQSSRYQPYFPGYIFINLNSELVNWSKIKWVPFTYGVVSYGSEPVSIPDEFISNLKKQLDDIQTPSNKTSVDFQHGDALRVTGGLFEGYEAVFLNCKSGTERSFVLLQLIENKFIQAEMPINFIQHVEEAVNY